METGLQGTLLAGRYEIAELLGTGGMADVHAAVDRKLERTVAVKTLRPAMAARSDVRRRFETEARAAASVSHPNAVAVFDTGEDDGVPYIVMERLPGETLADRIAGGPVEQTWLRGVALDVLGALGAAHAAGVVHRDVKPGNVLLAEDGQAKIGDFGIAKSLEALDDHTRADLTGTNQLVGTPAYLAPERIDSGPATPRSDLYSLGVTLYEALSGQKPFTGDNPMAVAFAVKHDDPVPLGDLCPDADPALVATVERAMARDPAARFNDAGEMAASLSGPADSTVVVAAPADATAVFDRPPALLPPAARPRMPFRPSHVLLLAGLVALLVALAAIVTRPGPRATTATGAPPANPLATELRDVATRVAVGDGPKGPEAATRLRAIADKVQNGDDASGDATALLRDAVAWHDDKQLGDTATAAVIAVLSKVPGVDTSVASTAPPPTPAPHHPPAKPHKHD